MTDWVCRFRLPVRLYLSQLPSPQYSLVPTFHVVFPRSHGCLNRVPTLFDGVLPRYIPCAATFGMYLFAW